MFTNTFAIAILLATTLSAAAVAQPQPAPMASTPPVAAGAVIYGPEGGVVGKIESVSGDNVVLDTGSVKATLPKSAFGSGPKGVSVTATKSQIEQLVSASAAKVAAALDAALAPGAEVRGRSGALIGTIKEVKGDMVLLDRPEGPVNLAKNAFANGANGLSISMTVDELDAAAKAAAPGN